MESEIAEIKNELRAMVYSEGRTPVPVKDFYLWTQEQSSALKARALASIDWEDLAEEVGDMGKSDQAKVASHMRNRMAHLLKWKYQAEMRTPSWQKTIRELLLEIEDEFEYSPSLRKYLAEQRPAIYRRAVRRAANETNRPEDFFPSECPFSEEELFDLEFLPREKGE